MIVFLHIHMPFLIITDADLCVIVVPPCTVPHKHLILPSKVHHLKEIKLFSRLAGVNLMIVYGH